MKNLIKYFGLVMVAVYFIAGIVLFTNIFSNTLSQKQRYIIGAMIIIYAIFRTFRIFKDQKGSKDEKGKNISI